MKKLVKNEKGQSAIEFLIGFIFTLALMFLFVRLALNFTTGYLAHYATFMASRVFLTQDNGYKNVSTVLGNASGGGRPDSAARLAKTVFNRYKLKMMGLKDRALRFNIPQSGGVLNEYVGAYYKFEKPISVFRAIGGDTKVEMLSESFLGKEAPRSECYRRTCWAMRETTGTCDSPELHVTLFDNGC